MWHTAPLGIIRTPTTKECLSVQCSIRITTKFPKWYLATAATACDGFHPPDKLEFGISVFDCLCFFTRAELCGLLCRRMINFAAGLSRCYPPTHLLIWHYQCWQRHKLSPPTGINLMCFWESRNPQKRNRIKTDRLRQFWLVGFDIVWEQPKPQK